MGNKILIADDELIIRELTYELLKDKFEVQTVKNGFEALEAAKSFQPDLALLDMEMPEIDGVETMCSLHQNFPGLPVLFLTGSRNMSRIQEAFSCGAEDYLIKPVQPNNLLSKIEVIFSRQVETTSRLKQRIWETRLELHDVKFEIITRLANAAEHRDPETGMHILRMAYYCGELGLEIGLPARECDLLVRAAPMHDIGKIAVPDHILLKPGKLTEEEFSIMKTHAETGAKILAGSQHELVRIAQKIAIAHHEKWDGSGYPLGHKGEDIPLWGRIAAVADVFDALSTKRPYKEPWTVEESLAEIERCKGTHFEPRLVDAFLKIKKRILEIKDKFADHADHSLAKQLANYQRCA
jgi:putative two-component system response regulator